jgi:branched-chain amino acid transport system ATP-binding protein
MAMLSVKDLEVFYGSIHAIKGVSFEVHEGEIVTLIGANGAGKTTILHAVSNLIRAKTGEIRFMGHDLRATEAPKIVRLGLAQVPEGRRIFSTLTVQENLEMGAYIRPDRENLSRDYEMVFERLPRLKERRKQLAGTLSGGEQQMLAIGRALMSSPKMLLLDEPSMGLSPILVQEIFNIITDVNKSGMTILLVEQNAKMALNIANRGYVLETGRVAMSGDAKDLLSNKQVKEAYLGG